MEPYRDLFRLVRFGPFAVDLHAGELFKGGHRLRLQEQPLQILAILLEHPGELVTRDEIRQKLWASDTFVDFDHGLNNAMNRLREALNDSAENPRYIETLPKRGYRFIGRLEAGGSGREAAGAPFSTPASSGTGEDLRGHSDAVQRLGEGPSPLRSPRPWILSISLLAVALLVGIGANRARLWPTGYSAAPLKLTVAVLPLENLCGDASQKYLADGITEELTTHMAQVAALRVISRTSASRFRNSKTSLPQIGNELKADKIVEGAVQCTAGNITVTAQLVDASSDLHLWAKSYSGGLADLPAMQGKMTREIARALHVVLAPQEQARFSRLENVNSEAYDSYLRARPYFGLETTKENEAAIQLLEKAVSVDPGFSLGYAALGTAYRIRAFNVLPQDPQWEEKATAAVEKALELNPDLAEAYVARGFLLWSRANHFAVETAVQDYRHALRLNPNLAEAHHQLSNIYNHVGLLGKAQEEIRQAVALDPLNTGIRFRVGINLLYQGRFQESLDSVRDSERFNPPLWAFQTSFALFQLGRRQEAEKRVSDFLQLHPDDPGGLLVSMQGLFAAAAGDWRSAEGFIQKARLKEQSYQHFHHTAYIIGSAYALMNQRKQALNYLRAAAEDGFPCYPFFERDPDLDPLRKDQRFIEFTAGLKRQWEHYAETL